MGVKFDGFLRASRKKESLRAERNGNGPGEGFAEAVFEIALNDQRCQRPPWPPR